MEHIIGNTLHIGDANFKGTTTTVQQTHLATKT